MPVCRFATAVFVVPALVIASRASAQNAIDPYLGRLVASVSLVGESDRPESSPALTSLVEVRVGEPLRVEAVRTSVGHLYGAGRLEGVEVVVTDAPDGRIDVRFSLVPRHPIDRLDVSGDTGLPPDELTRLVKERLGGRLPTEVRLRNVEDIATSLLADEGYLHAHATASTVPTHEPHRATLLLEVQAGVRARIGTITHTGTSPLSADEIESRTGTTRGSPFRARALQARLAAIRNDLRAKEYYEASATYRVVPSDDGQTVDVTLIVDAGPHVTLKWAGDPLPAGNPEDFVPIRRESSADEDLLDDSNRRLEAALRREGYKNAHAEHSREARGSELIVTFTITRGLRYRIDHIEIAGNNSVPPATIEAELGVGSTDVFWEDRVNAGAGTVLRDYQRRGFYASHIDAVYEELPASAAATESREIVRLTITEGPRGAITDVAVNGANLTRAADVRARMRSKPGGPYVPADVQADRDDVDTYYRNLGFQAAAVKISPQFGDEGRAVTLVVDVAEGPQIFVDDIEVIGNVHVSQKFIKAEMKLQPGQPLGEADQLDSQRRLSNTQLFRSVVITEEPLLPGETRARVLVTVEEAPATTIGYGGGLEGGLRPRAAVGGGLEDFFELAPRGFFEIGQRNLWGKNRAVDLFARLGLRPRSAPGDPTRDGRGFGFSEYLASATYREPHAFQTDTDLLVTTFREQAKRTSFNFIRYGLNANLVRRLTPRVSVSGLYSLAFTRLLDVRIDPNDLTVERAFPQVRLSTLSSSVAWDRRDNSIAPSRGLFVSGDGDLALRAIGSEVGYDKTFVQVSAFHSLTATHRFVLAGRAETGLAHGFPRTVTGPDGQPVVVAALPASQRFFAGGSTTVRGFEQDRLGVPAVLTADGLSNGGNALIVLNAELRTVVGKLFGHNIGGVFFMDAGNVFPTVSDLDVRQLRGAMGFGLRYDSPLGPLRLDFGFKMDRHLIGGALERGWAYHLNLGEAF